MNKNSTKTSKPTKTSKVSASKLNNLAKIEADKAINKAKTQRATAKPILQQMKSGGINVIEQMIEVSLNYEKSGVLRGRLPGEDPISYAREMEMVQLISSMRPDTKEIPKDPFSNVVSIDAWKRSSRNATIAT